MLEFRVNAASAMKAGLVLIATKLYVSPIDRKTCSPVVCMDTASVKIHAFVIRGGKELNVILEYVITAKTANASGQENVIAFMVGET